MEDFLPQLLKAIEETFGRPGLIMTNVLLIAIGTTLFLGVVWYGIDFSRKITGWIAGWAVPLGKLLRVSNLMGMLAAIPFRSKLDDLVRPLSGRDTTVAVAFGLYLWWLGTYYPAATLPVSYPAAAGAITTIVLLIAVRQLRATLGVPSHSPSLTVFYDDESEACKRDIPLGDEGKQRLWRVGVKSTSGQLTKGVIVRLVEADPRIPDLPGALHPMGGEGIGDTQWRGEGSFDIRPGDTEYVEVLRHNRTSRGDSLWVVFQRAAPIGRAIEYRSYSIQLTAIGTDGQNTSSRFRFEIGHEGPQFMHVPSIDNTS